MTTTNKKWQANIASAVDEIDASTTAPSSMSVSYQLPNWLPYLLCLTLGFLVAKSWLTDAPPHPINNDRDYATGGKAALLMVAEDIQSYWDTYGALPDKVPGPLAQVVDVTYDRINDRHFRLSMQHGNSRLVFDGAEDNLYLE